MESAERHAHRGPKAPPRPPAPPEIALYGPSAAAVRDVCAALSRALPPDLRVAVAADPSIPPDPALASQDALHRAESLHRVRLDAPAWQPRDRRAALADCDLVLCPGRPTADRPGILVLAGSAAGSGAAADPAPDPAAPNAQGESPAAAPPTGDGHGAPPIGGAGHRTAGIIACVGHSAPPGLPDGVAVVPPDRGDILAARVLACLRAARAPLYGLVLGGGRSERMGRDKAALEYHGMPQTRRGLELLAPHCESAFVSCRAEQSADPAFAGLPQIHDTFLGFGPLGGILSALRARPGAAFLVIACDLPFLDAPTLAALAEGRDPLRAVTAFRGPQGGLPEPLCAIYEPRAYPRALQLLGQGIDCPRKLILNSSAALLDAPDIGALRNVNAPDEYDSARRSL